MLTAETIKSVPALTSLPDDAIQALVTLSANDENAVIAAKLKEVHDQYDLDIKTVTGREKPGGVKTYDHLKNVLLEYKVKSENGAGEWKTKAEQLEAAKAELERKIKEGGNDAALKSQLEAAHKTIEDEKNRTKALAKQIEDINQNTAKELERAKAENNALLVGMEFERGLAGVRFKDEKLIPKPVRDTYIEAAKSRIMSAYEVDMMEEGATKKIIFRDKNGMIVSNPNNLQNPFTPGEMLLKEIADILDASKGGTGTTGKQGSQGVPAGQFRTKTEATAYFRQQLAEQGVQAGTPEHAAKMDEMYKEHNVSALPMK